MKKVPMALDWMVPGVADTARVQWVSEDIVEHLITQGYYYAHIAFGKREAYWADKRREVERQMVLNNSHSTKFDNWYS